MTVDAPGATAPQGAPGTPGQQMAGAVGTLDDLVGFVVQVS